MQFSPYRVLFLAANPSSTSRLRLDREIRAVDESLRRSRYRDQFRLFQQQAARIIDLRRALLDVKPHILHFSGHGAGKEGLLFDDDQTGYVMVDSSMLANLVKLSPHIKCVVLNACHSYVQAMAIAQHIPYAIGMEREIGDEAAIQFSQAFYDAIFAGEAIAKAYHFGIANGKGQPAIYDARTITVASESETDSPLSTIPVLIVGKADDPDQGQFRLNAPGADGLGAIQFGPVGPQATGQGILQIQAQSLTGCVINNIVQIGSNPHSEAMPQAKTVGVKAQPRPLPVQLPPRAFPQLVGRQAEVEMAISTLPYRQPVEFYGQAGIGKTVLLRHLAHHPAIAPAFSGGLIYHRIRQYQSASDILQVLFNTFYETETPYKPTNAEIRQFLQNRDVLTLLDGSELSREQVDALLAELPDFTFLLTSNERQLWGEGRSIKLDGLTATSAIALVTREVGRTLTTAEQQAVTQLCAALQGHPMRLLQAAALVREEKKELGAIALQFQSAPDETAQYRQLVASLQKPQLLILSLLAALGGKAVAAEMIAATTRLPDVKTNLEALVRRYLVVIEVDAAEETGQERYRLSHNFLAFLGSAAGLGAWKLTVVDFFTRWVARQPDLALLTDNAEVLHQAMQWAIEAEQWPQVIHIGKSLESAFALNGQWDAWKRVLESLLQAAQATGDPVVEAYALHQLGSRALGLNELTEAQDCLEQALEIRTELGDRAGIEATQQNLDFLRPLLFNPPSTPSGPPVSLDPPAPLVPLLSPAPDTPARASRKWPWILAGVGIIGAAITGVLVSLSPTPPPSPEAQLIGLRLPSTVQGTQLVRGQVELSTPATEPITITLSTNNPAVVTVQSSITLASGMSQGNFTLTIKEVTEKTDVIIQAAYNNEEEVRTLTLLPNELPPVELKALRIDEPKEVDGGKSTGGTVELTQPAPVDITLELRSSDPAFGAVPATITIAAGATMSNRFEITTQPVNERVPLTITAVYGEQSVEDSFTVVPQTRRIPSIQLRFDPTQVEAYRTTLGAVFLDSPVSEDVTVQIESQDPDIAFFNGSTVTIPAGHTSAEFEVQVEWIENALEGEIKPAEFVASYAGQLHVATLNVIAFSQIPCGNAPGETGEGLIINVAETASRGETVQGTTGLENCISWNREEIVLTLSSNSAQRLTPQVSPGTDGAFSFLVPNDLQSDSITIDFYYNGQKIQSREITIGQPDTEQPNTEQPGDATENPPSDVEEESDYPVLF